MHNWLDEIVMRLIDAVISIPPLILALVILSGFGSSPLLLILTVALVYSPRVSRIARAAALEIIAEDFVTAARARGESSWAIAVHELLPNAIGNLLVEFTIRSGFAVVTIGSLGFLGFGVQPPTPEWGLMISQSRNAIATAPWTVIFPGLAMSSLVVGIKFSTQIVAGALGYSPRRVPQ
jgi:peptide/nickel transport system permease protein